MTSGGIYGEAYGERSDLTSRAALASHATGGGRPQLALSLAGSDLSDSELASVGGFVRGLQTTLVARLARGAGAQISLSPAERAQLQAQQEDYKDVDVDAADGEDDPRGWLSKAIGAVGDAIGNVGEFLVENPVSQAVLTGFDKTLDAVKLPARLLSDAVDGANNDEIAQQMQAQGYDTGSKWDYIQFMYNQGDSLFHDLDAQRDKYGSDVVDLAMSYYADPEAFQDRLAKEPDSEWATRANEIMQRSDWEKAAEEIDRKHISPGRDIANLILTDGMDDGALFTAISGTLDAVYTIALDPTLIVGKAARLARAADAATGALQGANGLTRYGISARLAKHMAGAWGGYYRRGIANAADTNGVRALFRTKQLEDGTKVAATQVGAETQKFLTSAKRLRELKSKGDAESLAEYDRLYAGMARRHPALMPLLDEVNGRRVVAAAEDGTPSPATLADRGVTTPPTAPYTEGALTDVSRGVMHPDRHTRGAEGASQPLKEDHPEGWLSDTNGQGHLWRTSDPIEDLDDFAEYMASTAGLLRMGNGVAAETVTVMPGRITARAQIGAWFREKRVGRQQARDQQIFDHSKLGRNIPTPEENALVDALEGHTEEEIRSALAARGRAQRNLLTTGRVDAGKKRDVNGFQAGNADLGLEQDALSWYERVGDLAASARKSRAKWDQRLRRMATLMPTVQHLDLSSAAHAEQVRRFARLYLNRTDADRMAAMWTRGNEAERRKLAKGMLEQTYHASGLSASEFGRAWWKRYEDDAARVDKQRYGFEDFDLIRTEGGDRRVALHLSQLSNRVLLPSFREMSYMASKYNAASWLQRNVGARFLSDGMDSALTSIKMGWITTPAGGLRNAVDELAVLTLRGENRDWLKFRSLYTQATRDMRAKRREMSYDYQRLVREGGGGELGRKHAEEVIGARVKAADDAAIANGASQAERVEERRKAAALENVIRHRIPLWVRSAADNVNDYLWGEAAGRYLRARGRITDEELRYLGELVDLQRAGLTSHVIGDTFYGDDRAGITDAESVRALAERGVASQQYRWKSLGYEVVEVDGGAGVDAWAATLRQMFEDPADPAHVVLRELWNSRGNAAQAQQAVRDYIANDARMAGARQQMEVLNTTRSGQRIHPDDEVARQQAIDDYAERVTANVVTAITGRGAQQWDPEVVQAARDWFGERGRHRNGLTAADARERQAELDAEVQSAEEEYLHFRDEFESLKAGKRTDAKVKLTQSRLEKAKQQLADRQAKLARWEGEPDPDPTALLRHKQAVEWHRTQVDAAETRLATKRYEVREKLKPRQPDPDRVTAARGDVEAAHAAFIQARREAKKNPSPQAHKTLSEAARALKRARHHRDNVNRVRPALKDETTKKLQAELRQVEAETRKVRRELHKAMDRLEEAEGRRPTKPEEILAQREKVAAAQERVAQHEQELAEHTARQSELGGAVADDELDTAARELTAARAKRNSARSRAVSNQRAAERSDRVAASYEHTGHLDDKQIRKYLRDVRGLEPREGEFANGAINPELAEMLLAGVTPDTTFLGRLGEEWKPRHAIKQQFAPVFPTSTGGKLLGNYTEILAKAYKKVVTDQVQAVVRNPLFASKYVTARQKLAEYEKHLVANGWNEELAAGIVKKMAHSHAEQATIKHIDNPEVASQFSILARNFWAFERATEDALRRWGRALRDDPTVIRRAQLAVHAGEAAGLLHHDDEGNLTFTYPGSGALVQALTKILPGSSINVPVVPDLSSRLTFINPALDNPLGFSATPVISVPWKVMSRFFGPEHAVLTSEVDTLLNGELGAGREWYEQLLPTPINRIINGAVREDSASRYGQAFMQAVANLEMAGVLDELTRDPETGQFDPGQLEAVYNTLRSQIKNNMIATALYGMWAPATPGLPENAVDGEWLADHIDRDQFPEGEVGDEQFAEAVRDAERVGEADWIYHKQGLENVRAEWQEISNKLPYADAMAYWTKHHPGELVVATARKTEVASAGSEAHVSATLTGVGWMESNQAFLAKYPGIATYFIPQGDPNGPGGQFSQVAYRAQIEQGIRQRVGLHEYLENVIVSRGEQQYYTARKPYKEAIERAQQAGDTGRVAQLQAAWTQEKNLIYAANPLLAAKQATFAENEARREAAMRDLATMMNDPESFRAIGNQALGVQDLLDAFRRYSTGMEQIKGQRGTAAVSRRAQLQRQYEARVETITQAYPNLDDLASGLFRIPS